MQYEEMHLMQTVDEMQQVDREDMTSGKMIDYG